MKKKLFAVLALLCASLQQVAADNVILTSPQYYAIYAVSPNGKWACGAYNDYTYTDYGFRWNLETGQIELLGSSFSSTAWSVSDNGVVAGTFTDPQTTMEMPGYWKDGSWNRVEAPEGVSGEGNGFGITPDGHYMSGYLVFDGVYNPFIWKDGKIYRNMADGAYGLPWCISPDGQTAGGWSYPSHSGSNRCSAYWTSSGEKKFLNDCEQMWCGAVKFSPDGKKLLFWGGWNDNRKEWPTLAALYDVETGKIDSIPALTEESGLIVYGISDSYTVVGATETQFGGAVVYTNNTMMSAYDYLTARGVSFDGIDIAEIDGVPYFFRAVNLSADDSCMGLLYYDKSEGQYRSMIVKMDQKAGETAPVNLTAKQMQGINTVYLTWGKNLNASDVLGYNIYRDGVKVNSEPVSEMKYYDKVPAEGTYTYTVASVYEDNELVSDGVSVTVEAQALSVPQTLFGRQKGINGAHIQWLAPATNFIGRTYVDIESANVQGFGTNEPTSLEVGVRFDKDDIANYAGNKLTSVQFYPMDPKATGWKVNVYTYTADNTLSRIVSQNITQTLDYRAWNTVVLDSPVDLPEGELVVAIECTVTEANTSVVGMDFGHCTSEYSDLLRRTSEADFYALSAAATQVPYYVSWLINVILAPEDADIEADEVDHYTVYADGNAVGETADLSYNIGSLADGEHALGVSATYADGRTSAVVETNLTIATNYKAVDNVDLELNGETAVDVSWDVPAVADDDETFLTYASGDDSGMAPKGPEAYNYGLMASVVFPSSMLKGYDGYTIRSFRFYPTADALFTFYLYKNEEEICMVEVYDYELGEWNTVELPEEITIDQTSEYRLMLDCYDVTPEKAPLAVDNTSAHQFYSDLYSLDGASWSSMSDTGIYGNWMLGWVMADENGEPLTVSGYDVNIDGVKKNQNMLTDTKFTYDFGTEVAGKHSISVDTYYPSAVEIVKGNVTYFIIKDNSTGVSDNTVETFRLRLGENYLRVEGDDVQTVTAYSLSGAKAASVKGNTLNITGLVPGVYVIKAKSAEGELVRKIEIRK